MLQKSIQKRKKVSSEIKKVKARYYKTEVEQNLGKPKERRRTINELTYRKCTSSFSTELKCDNNSSIKLFRKFKQKSKTAET